MEHFRPKLAIWRLGRPGIERDGLNNVKGRTFHKAPDEGCFDAGYWWLAYAWDNYLVACGSCNRTWKSCLFPVERARADAPQPGDEAEELPLLLDPYGEVDPALHLTFDQLGTVSALDGSPIGQATIETLGLWRVSVQTSRREKAKETWRVLQIVEDAAAAGQDDVVRERLGDLARLGEAGTAHAGMVRCVVVQKTGLPWEEVERLATPGP